MSTAHASAEQQRAADEARRRKRRERAARSRAPEPKEIVSGAGQPLDPGARRELEEQLGHDLGRVRLHTDRDAGALTDMLGADAVAVGQDIFFREGTYAPGTTEGQRLLVHELLHTVQNPYGHGALTTGRDLGAVSLPHEAAEREAESAAQALVRDEDTTDPAHETAQDVEQGRTTPAWLRYATVDADRTRLERTDPATLVDRLAHTVMRALRADPEDRSKRTRMHLARLPEEVEDAVLDRLESRLLSSEHEQLMDLVDALERDDDVDRNQGGLTAPLLAPDAVEELAQEREAEQRDAAERQAEQARPATAAGPEKEQTTSGGAEGSTPQNDTGTTPQGGTPGASAGKAEEEQQPDPHTGGDASSPRGDGKQPDSPAAQSEQAGNGGRDEQDAQSGSSTQGEKDGKEGPEKGEQDRGQKEKEAGDRSEGKQAEEKSKEESRQEESAGPVTEDGKDEDRQRERDAGAAGAKRQQEQEGRGEQEGLLAGAKKDEEFPGRAGTLDGARSQDLLGEEEPEKTPAKGGDSEVDAGGGEKSAWDTKLRPEDFLPAQDLDVSSVPTADQLDPGSNAEPAMPSFPAPPPTKAEQVKAEREQEDQEDAEREARAEKDDPGTEDSPPVPGAEEEAAREKQQRAENQQDREDESEPRPGPGVATKDPTLGADPKDGPAAAEAVAQEGKERGRGEGDTEEKAAEEQKDKGGSDGKNSGGPGDRTPSGGEKESGEARSDTSAAEKPGGEKEETGGEKSGDGAGTSAEGRTEGSGGTEGRPSGSEKSQESPGPQESRGPKDEGGGGGTSSGSTGASGLSGDESGSRASDADSSGSSSSSSAGEQEPGPSAKSAPAGGGSGSRKEARASSPPERTRAQQSRPEKPQDQPQAAQAQPKDESGDSGGSGAKAAPASSGGSGGGKAGGGGGAAKGRGSGKGKSKASKAAPNLSGVSPEEGLATAGNLKPHQAVEAMDGVGSAADKDVGKEHQQLASKPPAMKRPSGSPKTLQGKPEAEAAAEYNKDKAERAEDAEDEQAEVTGEKKPEGKIAAEEQEEPGFFDQVGMMAGYAIGAIGDWLGFDVSAEDLAAQFAGMPTKDEALEQAKTGNAPGVDMKGQGDAKAEEQGGHSDARSEETAETGSDDAGRGMGEDQVYPDAPEERLEGQVPAVEGGKGQGVGGGGAGTGQIPPDAASEVAEKKRKPQLKKAIGDGRQGISKSREKKDQDTKKSQDQHKRQVDKEVDSNTKQQTGKREGVLKDVDQQRSDWTEEQDGELRKLGSKNSEREKKVRKDVEEKEEKTDEDVEKEKESSDKKVKEKGDNAEKDAEKRRDDDTKESKNWLSKALDWIKEQFIRLRDAVVGIIKAAREAVVEALKNFKETVEGWINAARKGIVELIKQFIEDLIDFVMSLVEAIIDIAKRIRKFITDLIEAALALVQKLADMLKKVLSDLLEAIGKLLSKILGALKKMFLDVIKACKDALKATLDFAKKLISGFGEFMMVLVDILRDPAGWLAGAASSAHDGAKNHLFNEVKSAVKGWFDQKVKEITGLTEAVYKKLMQGGWTLEKIATEVWNAIVPQLPMIIGEIIITKVIAKLIPGGGWGTALLEVIMAAINSLGEILKAMGAVLAWLKSVRKGGAGKLFAQAIAAGIVVVLEMAYQLILSGIGKYVSKVGKRLRGIAANIGKKDGKGDKGPADGPADSGDTNKTDGDTNKKDEAAADKPSDKAATPVGGSRADATPQTVRRGDKPDRRDGGARRDEGGKGQPGNRSGDGRTTSTTKNDNRGNRDHTPDTPNTRKKDKDGTKDKPTVQRKDKDSDSPSTKPDSKKDKNKDNDKTPSKDSTKSTDPSTKNKNGESKNKDQDGDKPKHDAKPSPAPRSKPKQDKDKTDSDGSGKKAPDTGSKKDKESDGPGKKDPDSGSNKNEGSSSKKDPDGEGGKKNGDSKKDTDSKGGKKDDDTSGRLKSDKAKEDRDAEENSDKEKSKRLALIIARIRPIIKRNTKHGMPDGDFRALLTRLRLQYRLKRLYGVDSPDMTLFAGLSPTSPFETQYEEQGQAQDRVFDDKQLKEEGKLPKPDLPDFNSARADKIEAGYLSKEVRGTGKEPQGWSNPDGWDYITRHGMSEGSKWVRMHLLPERLGGMPTNNNLVPARGPSVNIPMRADLEDGAYNAIGAKKPMIWYESWVDFHDETEDVNGEKLEGFPKRITSAYGFYTKNREPGDEGNHWSKNGTPEDANMIDNIELPTPEEHNQLLINSAGETSIRNFLNKEDEHFAITIPRYIAGKDGNGAQKTKEVNGETVKDPHPRYDDVEDIKNYLETRRHEMQSATASRIERVLTRLRDLHEDGKINWGI